MAEAQLVTMQHSPTTVPATTSGGSPILALIDRVSRDPGVPIEKIEQFLAMQERMEARQAERFFNDAMAGAQAEMRPVATDSENSQTKSKYASYAALDRAMRPVYTRHGFALSFNTEPGAPENHIRMACHVTHRDGHTRRYQLDMPADGQGAKGGAVMTRTHAIGSGLTYGQRYLLKMIFNIAVGDAGDDDDGNAAGTVDYITQDQADKIRDLLESKGASVPSFLRWAKVDRIEAIPAEHYDSCVDAISQFKPNGGAK